ncbi:chromatin assembly factor 1 subunit A isoform X2 [Brienomyrus brachyistius]|uniref:chromatin assembly factor 1 subunit A isoform X2 n=1 Tax=Brienomyrus brachyistius TaxID=42636 RepID=UPI0020B21C09|nr:chromatin assembly factor 1 subunit A isoform X2 [Brienomyrus brachyistius]
MVVMLATEDPSSEGPLPTIPRGKGMDCKDKSNTAVKKLVQARLPFKRLNPVPKENGELKKSRSTVAPPNLKTEASDGENEMECSSLPLPREKILVNGVGPLDIFVSRRNCSLGSAITIDLTEDSNSVDGTLQPAVALPPTSGPSTQEDQPKKDPEPVQDSITKPSLGSIADVASNPQSGSAQEEHLLVSEPEEDGEAEVSSHGNESLQSPSSVSSVSVVESSPETAKTTCTPPSAGPKTNANASEGKVKRRSLKGSEEQRRQQQEQRMERNRLRQEAQAAKEKKREEARRLKEERERERKEKKERDEKEKREKKEREEREKAEKQRAKEEQRKVKQEAKLEEKRKKEEEKRLKEEKDRIKAEKGEITRFLQKPKTQQAPKTLAAACGKFAPFEIKEHMCLAPLNRVVCEDEVLDSLDRYLAQPDITLDGLRDFRRHKPRRSGRTDLWHSEPFSVVLIESQKPDGVPDRQDCGRMKLLQFHENYRPAYWGTWSKKSLVVSPRCPFRQDKELLDYEVDSDEEWEEEEPGESLSHSEGDEEEEGGEDDDDDDGFFVPHGYLSDGEGALEEEEGGDPEKQKVRQKLKAREWDELMSKKKFKVLEAVVTGCTWESEGLEAELLHPYAVCLLEPLPKEEPSTPEGPSREVLDEQMLSALLPLLHGNVNSSKVIITEFQEFCRQQLPSPTNSPQSDNVPKRIHLKKLIKESAVYEKRANYRRCCWYVHAEVLARFDQEALPIPCQWTYVTPGAHSAREDGPGVSGAPNTSPTTPQSASNTPSSNKRKSAGSMSITKFMKKCANPEQGDAMETDGFQADTEDDEDETDCIIIGMDPGSTKELMEVATSEPAASALSCQAPTPASA